MTERRSFNRISALLLALFVFLAAFPPGLVSAADTKTYVVGASGRFGVIQTDLGMSGFACDYVDQLAKYTQNRFTYAEGLPGELFDMLRSGEIDLIPCVSEEELERYGGSGEFAAAGFSMITKFNAIYVYDKGEYGSVPFNDVLDVRKMRIGYLPEDEEEFFPNGKFVKSELENARFVRYNTEATMKDDFISGKLGAVAKSCFRPWEDETIVHQFGASSCYFVTRADDTALAASITNAMSELFMNYPTFPGDIYQKNISAYGALKYAYTKSERHFINNNGSITVAFNLGSDATLSYDPASEKITGNIGSTMERIVENTGLNIRVKTYGSLTDCMKAMDDGEADIVYGGIPPGGIESFSGCYVTAPVTRSPMVIAGKHGSELTETSAIAIAGTEIETIEFLGRFRSQAGISRYTTNLVACEMVAKGNESFVCMDTQSAMYLKFTQYEDLQIYSVLPIYRMECFAISRTHGELISIMEKAIAHINGNASVADYYTILNSADVDLDRNSEWLWLTIGGYILLGSALVVFIVLTAVKSRRIVEIDTLTGGRTKQRYLADSEKAIKKTGPGEWAEVVFDIDKFKYINDRFGYAEGDRVLERLYKTIGDHMEQGEVYARISDDNFACTIRNASDNDIESRINSIFTEFDRRNSLFISYPVVFSAGVCRLEQCADRYDMVDFNIAIDRCNIAKRTIKNRHSSEIAFYDGKIRENALREKDYENIMPTALKEHEFMCYIQPKYGTHSRHIEGGEALIRWNSKEFGFVYPDRFIPIAEKNGFVVELDFFILEEVCKAMRRWLNRGLTPVVISVNQSRLHLDDDDYIWRLREIIDKYEIPYEYIELELTESVFTDNAELMLRIMQKLHDIGFKLSIDDFGSGYSSLNMLKDIPADVVKIDREFFSDTVNSQKGRAVISTVVDLAKNLDMEVISEGVETVEQVDFLEDIHCNMVQGYFFARPMTIKDFEELWMKDIERAAEEKRAARTEQSNA